MPAYPRAALEETPKHANRMPEEILQWINTPTTNASDLRNGGRRTASASSAVSRSVWSPFWLAILEFPSHRPGGSRLASLRHLRRGGGKSDAEQTRQRGQALLTDFPHSTYAALTALRLAKLAMDSGDTTAASQRLGMGDRQRPTDELRISPDCDWRGYCPPLVGPRKPEAAGERDHHHLDGRAR